MEKVLEHVSENLSVEIFPDDKFEFLITTNEAAKGFGINPSSLRSQKHDHRDELIEGKHFITSVGISNAGCKSGGYLQISKFFGLSAVLSVSASSSSLNGRKCFVTGQRT